MISLQICELITSFLFNVFTIRRNNIVFHIIQEVDSIAQWSFPVSYQIHCANPLELISNKPPNWAPFQNQHHLSGLCCKPQPNAHTQQKHTFVQNSKDLCLYHRVEVILILSIKYSTLLLQCKKQTHVLVQIMRFSVSYKAGHKWLRTQCSEANLE